MHKLILHYSNTDFPTIPHTTLTKGVSYTRNLTSKKHTISTFVDQTYIQITHKHRENAAFKTIGLPLNRRQGQARTWTTRIYKLTKTLNYFFFCSFSYLLTKAQAVSHIPCEVRYFYTSRFVLVISKI